MKVDVGPHELHLGDTLEVMRGLSPSRYDVVLTDPPFSSGTRREAARSLRGAMTRRADSWFGTDNLTTAGFEYLMRRCAMEWARVLKPGGHVLCFIDWRMSGHLSDVIESADLRKLSLLVWDKTFFGTGACFRNQHELILHFSKGAPSKPLRRDVGNVIPCKPIRGGDHPTEKPVELLKTLLSVVCPPGGRVLDNFMGSGSSGVAAAEYGATFAGIERDPGHFTTATGRLTKRI